MTRNWVRSSAKDFLTQFKKKNYSEDILIKLALSFRFNFFQKRITTFFIWYVSKICLKLLKFPFVLKVCIWFDSGYLFIFSSFYLVETYLIPSIVLFWFYYFGSIVIFEAFVIERVITHSSCWKSAQSYWNYWEKKNIRNSEQKNANIVQKSHKKMHAQPKKTESCQRYCFEYQFLFFTQSFLNDFFSLDFVWKFYFVWS